MNATDVPDTPIVTKAEQLAFRKLIEEMKHNGRECPKCGGMLAHYRLHGYRCTNPRCDGPYSGGNH